MGVGWLGWGIAIGLLIALGVGVLVLWLVKPPPEPGTPPGVPCNLQIGPVCPFTIQSWSLPTALAAAAGGLLAGGGFLWWWAQRHQGSAPEDRE